MNETNDGNAILEALRTLSKDQHLALRAVCSEVEQYYDTLSGIYVDLSSEWLVQPRKPDGTPRVVSLRNEHLLSLGTGLDRDIPVIICDTANHPAFANWNQNNRWFFAVASLKSRSGIRYARLGMVGKDPRPDFGLNDADFLMASIKRVAEILKI